MIVAIFIFHAPMVWNRTLDGGRHRLQAAFQLGNACSLVDISLSVRFPWATRGRVYHVVSKCVQTTQEDLQRWLRVSQATFEIVTYCKSKRSTNIEPDAKVIDATEAERALLLKAFGAPLKVGGKVSPVAVRGDVMIDVVAVVERALL